MVTDTSDAMQVQDLLNLYKDSGNREFLERAICYARDSRTPGEMEFVLTYDPNAQLSYAQKLDALKYGIRQNRGNIYDSTTDVGSLYRELFWDDEFDGPFYHVLRNEEGIASKQI